MIARKEIIVLNGGGHKGIVKISQIAGKQGYVKINCSLDFRPNEAKLYLIGDYIAQTVLNDTNCELEVPFSANGEVGCVLRSSSVTMFGGSGSKSEMLKKIDVFNREQSVKASSVATPKVSDSKPKTVTENAVDGEAVQVQSDKSEASELKKETIAERKEKAFVGVSSKHETSLFSEWTKYDGNNFYYAVKPQIDEMFICYPSENLLTNTVPNSKWVRVDAEDGYYVVGLLFDGDDPSFICYGVPQTDGNMQAPAELENTCVWLPVQDEAIAGYWMIYQSAKTGEIIK